jgi:DNA-binding transcriptional MocR family regulator
LNTFSKVLFPGLRIGWIAGSQSIIQLITRLKELSISTNTLGQLALAQFLKDGALAPHLAHARKLYAEQARLMESQLEPLRAHGVHYEKAAGGFYFWVSLPEEVEPRKLMHTCMKEGVSFTCGDMFLLREAEQPYIRLCYTHERAEQIEKGMSILTHVLYSQKEDSP